MSANKIDNLTIWHRMIPEILKAGPLSTEEVVAALRARKAYHNVQTLRGFPNVAAKHGLIRKSEQKRPDATGRHNVSVWEALPPKEPA